MVDENQRYQVSASSDKEWFESDKGTKKAAGR
jgi:hypothetical protein